MSYKNKLVFLLSLIGVLSLIYIAVIIFSPERRGARSSSYAWLDKKLADRIGRIIITSEGRKIELIKNNSQWFVLHNGVEYPARQMRIEDFIGIFTSYSAWNLRSSNASTHSRFGLDADAASRVMIYGENTLLLDLLLGYVDNAGQIYVRKYGEDEVRSGENVITYYLANYVTAWYNLRLFEESGNGYIDVDNVQRLSVYNSTETQIFSRVNRSWEISVSTPPPLSGFYNVNAEQGIVESYIRNLLNSEGDDFAGIRYSAAIDTSYSRIVVEFGNGKISTIRFSEPDEEGRRFACIDGSEYIYSIPAWVSTRLFRDAAGFERQ